MSMTYEHTEATAAALASFLETIGAELSLSAFEDDYLEHVDCRLSFGTSLRWQDEEGDWGTFTIRESELRHYEDTGRAATLWLHAYGRRGDEPQVIYLAHGDKLFAAPRWALVNGHDDGAFYAVRAIDAEARRWVNQSGTWVRYEIRKKPDG